MLSACEILKRKGNMYEKGFTKLPTKIASLAADVDHDGKITTQDSLMINQASVGKITLDQNYTIDTVPDECYYLDPVTF